MKKIKEELIMTQSLNQSDLSSSALTEAHHLSMLDETQNKNEDEEIDDVEQYSQFMSPELEDHEAKFKMNHEET